MASTLLIDIEEILRELCAERSINLESLLFFGSRVHDMVHDGSDVDFVLVSPTFEGKDIFQRTRMTKGMHRTLVKRFKVPFDIVLCSVSEWEQGISPLLHEIRGKEGDNHRDAGAFVKR